MRFSAGDKLGPYQIAESVGKGGMGEVYRRTDTRLGRPVAIKVSAREFNDRFERKARAISDLNHPNGCTLYDIGPNYLVMELVGQTGKEILFEGPNFTLMAVDVDGSGRGFRTGTPKQLFSTQNTVWDVTADGKRFPATVPPGLAQQGQCRSRF
jgi:hypothetical protein